MAITDAEQVKDLVLWARANRVSVTRVSCGSVALELADLALAQSLYPPAQPSDDDAADNLYREFGGEAFAQLTAEDPAHDDAMETYEDD